MAADEVNKPPSHPPYHEMILAAISALNDENGSNKSSILKYIENTYGELPSDHATQLSYHLNRMKDSGELVYSKNNYMRPNPNAPPKRGRGRPPKPKIPLPPGAVLAPPRPRGRPPKPRDPLAPVVRKPPSSSSGSGKPRGRPPKKARPPGVPGTGGGSPRPRGRPPKVKPQMAAVEGVM